MPQTDSALFQPGIQSSPNGVRSSAGSATSTFTLFRYAPTTYHSRTSLTHPQAKPRNKMHTDPEKLSHHVHRVGHHFPIEIVNLACSKFGYVYDEQRGLRKLTSAPNWIARGFEDYSSRQVLHGRPKTKSENKEDTRGAIREMFPKIPETDLNSIVNHAFEEVFASHHTIRAVLTLSRVQRG
jgi:hypothetical protein